MYMGGLSSGLKLPEHGVDLPLPPTAQAKMRDEFTSTVKYLKLSRRLNTMTSSRAMSQHV